MSVTTQVQEQIAQRHAEKQGKAIDRYRVLVGIIAGGDTLTSKQIDELLVAQEALGVTDEAFVNDCELFTKVAAYAPTYESREADAQETATAIRAANDLIVRLKAELALAEANRNTLVAQQNKDSMRHAAHREAIRNNPRLFSTEA